MNSEAAEKQDVEYFKSEVTSQLPASNKQLSTFAKAQSEDRACSRVINYSKHSWPGRHNVPTNLMIY